MDEAQRGREEEEGSSIGVLDQDGVPGAGRGGPRRTLATAGDRTTARWMPPSRVSEGAGGLFSLLLSIVADPCMAMARTVGISGRVIGVT